MYRSAGAVCSRARARARYTDRYKLFNLRMNGEILPGTQTKEEEEEKEAEKVEGKRRRGSPSPLLACKRKSPKSTSNESLSRFAAARPATCPGVKKAEEEAAAAAKEDQEIVGKRAIRFHYPSLAATSMLPVTHKFTSSSRRYYPAALSCVRARDARAGGTGGAATRGGEGGAGGRGKEAATVRGARGC